MDIFDLTPEEFVEKIGTGTIVHNSGQLHAFHQLAYAVVVET